MFTYTLFSDPPQAVYIGLESEEKFKICEYGWWDHSLAIGEWGGLVNYWKRPVTTSIVLYASRQQMWILAYLTLSHLSTVSIIWLFSVFQSDFVFRDSPLDYFHMCPVFVPLYDDHNSEDLRRKYDMLL